MSNVTQPTSPSPMLSSALWYARVAGFYVFPVFEPNGFGCSCLNPDCDHPGKHPRTAHGHLDAAREEAAIKEMWSSCPEASVAIACGPSGLVVLDHDIRTTHRPGHGDFVEYIRRKYGPLPETCTVLTGSGDGSTHDYFRHAWADADRTPSELEPGIDLKGRGGYVIAPPSRHCSGGAYEVDGLNGAKEFLKIVPAPPWMGAFLRDGSRHRHREEAEEKWTKGVRNDRMFRLSSSLRRNSMTVEEITTILSAANKVHCEPPLSDSEVSDIARSAGRYERGTPSGREETGAESHGLGPQVEAPNEWPEPQPLAGALPPVEAFYPELLPESLRAQAEDVAVRMQVPLDFSAVPLVLCLSGATGRRVRIQPKAKDGSFVVVPNLWGGIVGRSGLLKTPALQAVLRPLHHIQKLWREEHASELETYEEEKTEADIRFAAWKDQYKRYAKDGGTAPIRPDNSLRKPTSLTTLPLNPCTNACRRTRRAFSCIAMN